MSVIHVEEGGRGKGGLTLEEVALLDAELAYAGTEPEEGETEDGAKQGHGCRIIWASLGQMVRTSPGGDLVESESNTLNPYVGGKSGK